jgi:hypothetical protein
MQMHFVSFGSRYVGRESRLSASTAGSISLAFSFLFRGASVSRHIAGWDPRPRLQGISIVYPGRPIVAVERSAA